MARISHRLPKCHSIFKHQVLPMDDFKGEPMHLITTLMGKSHTYMCPMPLVLFVSIIEYGKMMLNRALQCLQRHLNPSSFRFLYCNVDNMIIASSVNTLDVAEFNNLLGNDPGQFKEEWCISSKPWQFVSPGRMQYCIACPGESRSKSCVIKGVSPKESFRIAMAMFNNINITVEQTQKCNKLVGPETRIVQFKL